MQRRIFLSHAVSMSSAAFLAQPLLAATISKESSAHQWTDELEKLIPPLMHAAKVPGVSIAIIRDGALSWSRGFGVRDTMSREPVDANTVFECASISKTVFAYAAMKLCEKGVIDLDTPLVKYWSKPWVENDARANKITARHLLSHTSGLPNWRSSEEPLKLYFDPGTSFRYSGEGYCYLQSVITHMVGNVDTLHCGTFEQDLQMCATDIDAYLNENVLMPFGMLSSGYVWRESLASNAAVAHDAEGQYFSKPNPTAIDMARYAAAGGLLTTVTDYSKFIVGLFEPREEHPFFLTRESLQEMLRPQVKLPAAQQIDGASSWALGWAVRERPEGNIIVHSGGQPGFRSLTMVSPERKSGFIILTNSDNGGKVIFDPQLMTLFNRLFTL